MLKLKTHLNLTKIKAASKSFSFHLQQKQQTKERYEKLSIPKREMFRTIIFHFYHQPAYHVFVFLYIDNPDGRVDTTTLFLWNFPSIKCTEIDFFRIKEAKVK
jgi:hypothetical protein